MAEERRPYGLGLLLGRFQTLHNGHIDMVSQALGVCETVGIFVGSSQESGTSKNPFSYELRKEMLRRVLGDRVVICPLKDIGVGNNSTWGDYVLDSSIEAFGKIPDLMVSGKENRRVEWLSSDRGLQIAELIVPKTIEVSASMMREFLIHDEKEAWQEYAPKEIWDLYDQLRDAVLKSMDHTETSSL